MILVNKMTHLKAINLAIEVSKMQKENNKGHLSFKINNPFLKIVNLTFYKAQEMENSETLTN